MSEDIRNNPYENSAGQPASKLPWVILALLALVIIIAAVVFRDRLFPANDGAGDTAAASDYQAVFLTNGQVYFGKLSNAYDQYVTLEDIYYLQVTNPPLQGSTESTAQQRQQQTQLILTKLGNELHGPLDSMQINREQILFYEDMKNSSQVVENIRKCQANPQCLNPTQAPAAGAPSNSGPANNTSANAAPAANTNAR